MSRKEGGRGLPRIEDSVHTSIRRLKDYIEKRGRRLIIATRKKNTKNTRENKTEIAGKQKWKETTLWTF